MEQRIERAREGEKLESVSPWTRSYQNAVNVELALSRPSASRCIFLDHLPPSGPSLLHEKALCSPGWSPPLSLYVLPPPVDNQSRSSYFRTIQPVPPVLCGLHAHSIRGAPEDSQWNSPTNALFANSFLSATTTANVGPLALSLDCTVKYPFNF